MVQQKGQRLMHMVQQMSEIDVYDTTNARG